MMIPCVTLVLVWLSLARDRGVGDGLGFALPCCVTFVLVAVIKYRRSVRRGQPFAPLIDGLPAEERKAAWRRIRRGEPSGNALLREIESETAQRIAAAGTNAALIALVVITAASFALLIAFSATRERIVLAALLAAIVGYAAWFIGLRHGARRYVAANAE